MKNLFEQLEMAEAAFSRVNESGIDNIRMWAKKYKQAEGYFHMDTDGVTSAIAMKKYLESYGIKTVDVHKINYGSNEFSAVKAKPGRLVWMVDFAHGKPFINIHTDHHDAQTGGTAQTSTAFAKTPSNVEDISMKISPSDLFPPKDIKVISMVDSAGFAKNGVSPDQVMRAAFGVDKTLDVERNHMMMGLVVNRLLLSYKNKPGFLEELVMKANPSLISMYNVIRDLAKKHGYKTPDEVGAGIGSYVEAQKGKIKGEKISPKRLSNGESTVWGTTIVQYGGGYMMKGYDRYTPFKLNPHAHYMVIGWPMGLVQVSKNPFISATNPYPLGDLIKGKVLSKWKSKLESKRISLAEIKRQFEMDIKPQDREAMGFNWDDFTSLVKQDQVKGVDLEGTAGWTQFIKSISNVKYNKLTMKQKANLEKITVSLWDIIIAQSGGHKDITNIQGFNFWGKGYVDEFMKPFMEDVAEEMEDKRLKT